MISCARLALVALWLVSRSCDYIATATMSTFSTDAQRGKWSLTLPSSVYSTAAGLSGGNSLNFTITFDHAFEVRFISQARGTHWFIRHPACTNAYRAFYVYRLHRRCC
jgi:hypothetical protein